MAKSETSNQDKINFIATLTKLENKLEKMATKQWINFKATENQSNAWQKVLWKYGTCFPRQHHMESSKSRSQILA